MEEKIQEAINKIDEEAEKAGTDSAKIIASHVIENYLFSEKNAKKVIDKNLDECLSKIRNKARKSAVGNCACISDATVFKWTKEYYGFEETNSSSSSKIVDLFDYI